MLLVVALLFNASIPHSLSALAVIFVAQIEVRWMDFI